MVTAASGNFGERFCPVDTRSLGSMAREAASFASRKCRVYKVSLTEASNGTIVLGAVLPRGLSLARSLARFLSFAVAASLLLFLIYESTICPWTPARSPRSSFRPSRSLPHLRATVFLLIYQSFWFSHRFHRNATARERRTTEDRNSCARTRTKGCDPRMEI